MIWYFVWFMLVRNDPQDDKLISESEKTYLKEKINYLSHKKVLIFFYYLNFTARVNL